MSLGFLPLCFDDEDYEIWLRLEQIEPERRTLYVKEILREVLLGEAGEGKLREGGAKPLKESQGNLISAESAPEAPNPLESSIEVPEGDFSLADLFVSSQAPSGEESPEPVQVSGPAGQADWAASSGQMKGLSHLLQQVIGEEKDEEVLSFFARRKERI